MFMANGSRLHPIKRSKKYADAQMDAFVGFVIGNESEAVEQTGVGGTV
jgi:hypothetical protein